MVPQTRLWSNGDYFAACQLHAAADVGFRIDIPLHHSLSRHLRECAIHSDSVLEKGSKARGGNRHEKCEDFPHGLEETTLQMQ